MGLNMGAVDGWTEISKKFDDKGVPFVTLYHPYELANIFSLQRLIAWQRQAKQRMPHVILVYNI